MEMKNNLDLEVERKKTVDRLLSIIEQGVPQEECFSLANCKCIRESIDSANMTIPQAHGYITLICEKYPKACELNQI